VRSFLESRSIDLPYGDPEEPPNFQTICGLGNRKNELVHELLASEGVEIYEGSLALLHHLRNVGIKTAVVSSSKNCQAVLAAAGLTELFDARVDGEVAARLHLPGKPAPDTFLHASEQLGVEPKRAVVVEDALSGVEASRAGGFGLVIGICPPRRSGGAQGARRRYRAARSSRAAVMRRQARYSLL
jgi:HAD superfamily hydrolase (TIGR01509 family)